MSHRPILAFTILLLSTTPTLAGPPERLAEALAELERNPNDASRIAVLDAAWRADDWAAGLRIARAVAALEKPGPGVLGPALRALWRAGELEEAVAFAERLPAAPDDRIALASLATLRLAQGRGAEADKLFARLETLGPQTANQAYAIVAARLQRDQTAGLVPLMTRARELIDDEAGYPDAFLGEATQGLVQLAEAIGRDPINIVSKMGSAPMPVISTVGLPSCRVMLNGKGPFNMLLDTGGSVTLSLNHAVAEEIDLPRIAEATIHGVGGAQEAFQTIIDDVRIGDIEMRRVLCHAFEMPEVLGGIDGIVGTGLFLTERFTMDFAEARLTVAASSEAAGQGAEIPLWITSDAKLIAWSQIEGTPGPAMIDSGADGSILSPAFVRERFPGRDMMEVELPAVAGVGQEGSGTMIFAPAVEFRIGDHTPDGVGGMALSVMDSTLGPMIGVQCDVLVGMNVLRQARRLTVDGPHCRGWIDWLER